MSIKLVVFDMAGTTVHDNDNVHQALINAFGKENIVISREDANRVMGIPKPTAIRHLLNKRYQGPRVIDDDFVEELHDGFVGEMIEFYEADPEVKEKEGASATFLKLKNKGIKVAVDTGFNRKIADVILKRLQWWEKGLLDCSVTSDEVRNGRPYPDMIYKAMAMTNINNVKEVAKVGDTTSDILEGKSAGCELVVGVTSGAYDKNALLKESPTRLIEKLSELLEFVN